MDPITKERLLEEARQRSFFDILERAGAEKDAADAATLKDEIMKVLGTPEAGTVKGLVEHIFNRATSEISADNTLAELCHLVPAHFDPPEPSAAPLKERGAGSRGSSEKRIDFRLMVLKKCKDELEKGTAALKACKAWDAKEGTKGTKGGGLKGEEKEQADLDRKAHARMLAAVTFCGALYNVGILTEKIIHTAIEALLKDEAQGHENMEVLAKLLRSVGSKLDGTSRSSKDGKAVDDYFKRVQKIKEEANSKDIAKMMATVLTLRDNNWQSSTA